MQALEILRLQQSVVPELLWEQQLAWVRELFKEYEAFLGINLDFQNFQSERDTLPGRYSMPTGGLYLAIAKDKEACQPAGCVAFYGMNLPDEPRTCELKRLFVREPFQGRSLGKAFIQRAIEDATHAGYQRMRLDSLHRLTQAKRLYDYFGFYDIAPYNQNPHEDVYYMEKAL
jgi:putative acetyltransferase